MDTEDTTKKINGPGFANMPVHKLGKVERLVPLAPLELANNISN